MHGPLEGMGESSVSLDIIRSSDLAAMAKSLGAADYILSQIASGRLTKKECVKAAKMAISLMKRFEEEGKQAS